MGIFEDAQEAQQESLMKDIQIEISIINMS